MPFVKLDVGILDSTLWVEKEQRDVFLTALLMAIPQEFTEPLPQIEVDSMKPTGFVAPPGWYGFCAAAGSGIVRRSLTDLGAGMKALRALGNPDPESRSKAFDGRRLIRVNGGFAVLNFMEYRDRDYGAADRMRRLRARRKEETPKTVKNVRRNVTPVRRNVTQAEAEAYLKHSLKSDALSVYSAYPRKVGKIKALVSIEKVLRQVPVETLLSKVEAFAAECKRKGTEEQFIPHPATWFNRGSYEDESLLRPLRKYRPGDPNSAADWAAAQVKDDLFV